MNTETKPRWILTEDWAIGIDPLNWKLYKRSHNRSTGKCTSWRVVGYYPKLGMLAESLTEKILLHDTQAHDAVSHLIRAVAAVEQVIYALKHQMTTMDRVGLDTLPPGYRKYAK